jgi:hypothetical protein
MKTFLGILDIIGYGTTIIVVIAVLVGIYQWITGISPALWRLGSGLAGRKIAVFAEGTDFSSLKSLLIDSKLFNEKNIVHITNNELRKAEKYSLFLVHWKSVSSHLDTILSQKKDGTALLIYAPQEEGFIQKEDIAKINQHRNVILVNFRGRLLNDIVTSLITTSYDL